MFIIPLAINSSSWEAILRVLSAERGVDRSSVVLASLPVKLAYWSLFALSVVLGSFF